jgi:hypothetical protein
VKPSRCQAFEMDEAATGVPDASMSCDGPADVQRRGFWLCAPCGDAFDLFMEVGRRAVKENGS